MSLSHPNVPSNKAGFQEDLLPCAECGQMTLERVTVDVKLEDGTLVPDLAHWRCSSCGEVLFDLDAMRQIREFRSKTPRTSRKIRSALNSSRVKLL